MSMRNRLRGLFDRYKLEDARWAKWRGDDDLALKLLLEIMINHIGPFECESEVLDGQGQPEDTDEQQAEEEYSETSELFGLPPPINPRSYDGERDEDGYLIR